MWWWTSNCSSLLIYRPREDERLSWPGWLTYNGRLTHISGHQSATGRAQDGERTLARNWRSTAEPRRPTKCTWLSMWQSICSSHSRNNLISLQDGTTCWNKIISKLLNTEIYFTLELFYINMEPQVNRAVWMNHHTLRRRQWGFLE